MTQKISAKSLQGGAPSALHSASSPDWGTPMILRRFSARALAPAAQGRAIDLDYASSRYWNQWWDEADRPHAFLDGSRGRDVLVEADRRAIAAQSRFGIGAGFFNPPGLGSGRMVQKCWALFETDHREQRIGSGVFVGFSVEQLGSLQNVGARNPLTTGADDLITTIIPSRRAHFVVHPEKLIASTRRKQKRHKRGSSEWRAMERLTEKLLRRTDDTPVDAGAPSHLSFVTFLWHPARAVRGAQMEAARHFLLEQRAEEKSLFHKFEVIGILKTRR